MDTMTLTDAINDHDGFDGHLRCPKCGEVNTHLEHVRIYGGGSDDNRYTAALEFSCESGCAFGVEVYNHKGYTLLQQVSCQFVS